MQNGAEIAIEVADGSSENEEKEFGTIWFTKDNVSQFFKTNQFENSRCHELFNLRRQSCQSYQSTVSQDNEKSPEKSFHEFFMQPIF